MNKLINQLCDATREWVEKTGESEQHVTFYVLVRTGGTTFYDRAKDNPQSFFSIEQMRNWLERLVRDLHIFEDFLVVAVIQDIDRHFEELSEDYAKGIRRARGHKEFMDEKLADPKMTEDFVERMNRKITEINLRENNIEPHPPFTADTLRKMQDSLETWSTPTLEEQRKRRIFLDTWREVTRPILQSENLEQEMFKDLS